MTEAEIVERVARAMAAADDEDYMEDYRVYDRRARAAIAAHKAVLAEVDEAAVEPIVKAEFMQWCVYGGYTRETKEMEWLRVRRIEVGRFLCHWRAMIKGDGLI